MFYIRNSRPTHVLMHKAYEQSVLVHELSPTSMQCLGGAGLGSPAVQEMGL